MLRLTFGPRPPHLLPPRQVHESESRGSLTTTGQLGDVFRESASIAHTYARRYAPSHPIPCCSPSPVPRLGMPLSPNPPLSNAAWQLNTRPELGTRVRMLACLAPCAANLPGVCMCGMHRHTHSLSLMLS